MPAIIKKTTHKTAKLDNPTIPNKISYTFLADIVRFFRLYFLFYFNIS